MSDTKPAPVELEKMTDGSWKSTQPIEPVDLLPEQLDALVLLALSQSGRETIAVLDSQVLSA